MLCFNQALVEMDSTYGCLHLGVLQHQARQAVQALRAATRDLMQGAATRAREDLHIAYSLAYDLSLAAEAQVMAYMRWCDGR